METTTNTSADTYFVESSATGTRFNGSQIFTPIAEDDTYATDEDVALTIAAPGILTNDHDPDAMEPLTVELVRGTGRGTLILSPDGGFEYTPDPDYFGLDFFTYRVFDGALYSNTDFIKGCYKYGPGCHSLPFA